MKLTNWNNEDHPYPSHYIKNTEQKEILHLPSVGVPELFCYLMTYKRLWLFLCPHQKSISITHFNINQLATLIFLTANYGA